MSSRKKRWNVLYNHMTPSHDPSPPQEKKTKKKNIKHLYKHEADANRSLRTRDWTAQLSITASEGGFGPKVAPHPRTRFKTEFTDDELKSHR